jgi:uncharacterized protein YkwD
MRALLAMALVGVGCSSSSGFRVDDGEPPPMSHPEAARYVLSLVNADRAQHGLDPVKWDDAAATAGQTHAEDMASLGFTAHYGSDGSVPELRHTRAGGDGMIMENVGCLADGKGRELEPTPTFTVAELERLERAFMDEVPPFDGHRRNILTAWHTSLGVGLAKPRGLDVACMAQEFVDDYGEYEGLPAEVTVGADVDVRGRLRAPAEVGGVGLSRMDLPAPLDAGTLNKTGSYQVPKPYLTFFPAGYKTMIPVETDGKTFSVRVPISDRDLPGVYSVSVWARLPQSDELLMVSLRTLVAR